MMMKKTRIVVGLIAAFFLMPHFCHAETGFVDGINYTLIKKAGVAHVTATGGSGSLVIPDEITYDGMTFIVSEIEAYAFQGQKYSSVTIGNNVERIGESAFAKCTMLESVSFGKNVKDVGIEAFMECRQLVKVYIQDLSSWCNITFQKKTSWDIAFSNPLYYAKHLYIGDTEVKDLVIPSGISVVKDYSFVNCEGLTSIVLPEGLSAIGQYAFYGCKGLSTMNVPRSLGHIKTSAFDGCKEMSLVKISDLKSWLSITFESHPLNSSPGGHLFLNGKEIVDLVIPEGVTMVGNNVFMNCGSLVSVVIPEGVETIGSSAFQGCISLEAPSFPVSLTSIGERAFQSCYRIVSLDIPGTVRSIGFSAFNDCQNLSSLKLSDGLKVLNGFSYCTRLTSVDIPSSVMEIGESAFEGSGVVSVVVPDGVASIGRGAFSKCKSLVSAVFPGSVRYIPVACFSYCKNLTSFKQSSNGFFEVLDKAFSYCEKLSTLRFMGEGKIYTQTFVNCPELKDVFLFSEKNIVEGWGNPFLNSYVEYATLHVPELLLSAYQASSVWSQFGKIVAITPEDIEAGAASPRSPTRQNEQFYSLGGCKSRLPHRGINIIDNGAGKKVKRIF